MILKCMWLKWTLANLKYMLYWKVLKKKDKKDNSNKKVYSFDVNKIDQILNLLLKDNWIKLLEGHKILAKEEIKGKNIINNYYFYFMKMIEKAIK